ncbi:MAG: O-antigen ligase family protein [Gammaproteobacteria bacterium]|nr:O-antigen ligase family protein [Gammaproteobacteria bacterium]
MTPSRSSKQQNRYLYFALLLLVAFIPIPHGGERFWEHAPFIVGAFALLSIWSFQQWHYNRPLPNVIRSCKIPLALLIAWLAYTIIQALPLPESWVTLFNPAAAEIQHHALALGAESLMSLSISAQDTLHEFLRNASYIALFFLALVLCTSKKRVKWLAITLFLVGVAQALYSLINYYSDGAFSFVGAIEPWGIPWRKATRGTYSHYNHFAALMEITIAIGIGITLTYAQRSQRGDRARSLLGQLLSFAMSIRMLYAFGILLMIAALILTASRGGSGAFAAAFFITLITFAVLKKGDTRALKLLLVTAIILVSALVLITPGRLDDRFGKQGVGANGRDHMRTITYELAADYPLVGSGTGTYPHIYYQYKPPKLGVSAMSKRAHNDYLELLTDQGIIGVSLLGASMILLLSTIIKGIRTRRDPVMQGLLFGSTLGIGSIMIHSLVEFNFHIPANASYFFILLAIGISASTLPRQRQ